MTIDLLIAGITALTGVGRCANPMYTSYEWQIYKDTRTEHGAGWVQYSIFLNLEAKSGEKVVVVSDDHDDSYGKVINSWFLDTAMLRAYDKAQREKNE